MLLGLEAIGPMQRFSESARRVGDRMPGWGRREDLCRGTRMQKHDRRDAELILRLLAEKSFPAIWRPSEELQCVNRE